MTELAVIESTSLALDPEQHYFTDAQVKALEHIGVENASTGDLQVFHHVCQRSGLDPFARQIHMIGRQVSVYDDNAGAWTKVTKQTIQTGIDGFRLIGRRAANQSGHKVSVGAPQWAHVDSGWQEIWSGGWGHPVAARVTIHRDGEPFTAVALFDEYKQTKRNGELTSMWAQRPAGQLAKCAEALAWRMAFPQDLSGIYADEEMQQADGASVVQGEVVEQGLAAALKNSGPEVSRGVVPSDSVAVGSDVIDPGPESEPAIDVEGEEVPMVSHAQLRNIGRLMGKKGLDITVREEALGYVSAKVGRTVESRSDLTLDEARSLIDALEADVALLTKDADQ